MLTTPNVRGPGLPCNAKPRKIRRTCQRRILVVPYPGYDVSTEPKTAYMKGRASLRDLKSGRVEIVLPQRWQEKSRRAQVAVLPLWITADPCEGELLRTNAKRSRQLYGQGSGNYLGNTVTYCSGRLLRKYNEVICLRRLFDSQTRASVPITVALGASTH